MPDDTEVQFDPSTITVAEAELIEQLTDGIPYGETIRAMMTMRASVAQLKAVTVMIRRRTNPEFSIEDIAPDAEIRALHGA